MLMTDLLALHRYYIWANRFREYFDGAISIMPLSAQLETVFVDDSWLFLCHWYAGLYVVVEGWQRLQLQDAKIEALLTPPNITFLCRFRNGVYHYQRNYSDPRFLDLMQARGVVPWVRQLNLEFGRYFLQNFQNQVSKTSAIP